MDDLFWIVLILIIAIVVYVRKEENKHGNQSKTTPIQEFRNEYKPDEVITTYVVGVTFENRQEFIKKLTIGSRLGLKRETDNQYDENAISVTYTWFDTKANQVVIGYINRDLAIKIAPFFDNYAWGPNNVVSCEVVGLIGGHNKPLGVQITFRLPSKESLEIEMMKEIYRDWPPF